MELRRGGAVRRKEFCMGCFRFLSRMAAAAMISTGIAAAVTVNNPIMYVDSPDPSIVRVDDA